MACGAIPESMQLPSRWRLPGLRSRWASPAVLAPVQPFQWLGRQTCHKGNPKLGREVASAAPPPRCAWSPSPAASRHGRKAPLPASSSPTKWGRGTAQRAVEGVGAARVLGSCNHFVIPCPWRRSPGRASPVANAIRLGGISEKPYYVPTGLARKCLFFRDRTSPSPTGCYRCSRRGLPASSEQDYHSGQGFIRGIPM